LTNNIRDMIWS